MSWTTQRKRVQFALTAVGVGLLLYLVSRVGLGVVSDNLRHFGWWLALTCLLAALWLFLQASAWWRIQATFFTRVPLLALYRVKFISDAFNLILPSASMGGDAMRAFLIRQHAPLRAGIPGVLFDKTIEFVASILFLCTGLLLGVLSLHLPKILVGAALATIAMTGLVIALLVLFQRIGVTNALLRLSAIFPRAKHWIGDRREQFAAMDENFRLLYSGSMFRAVPPLVLHLGSRMVGVIEFMLVLYVLDAPVTFVQGIFISAMVTVGNTAFFALPGQWGVMESVHMLVLQSLGYPASIGLSLSIIRRIRRLAVIGFALLLFATRSDKGAETF